MEWVRGALGGCEQRHEGLMFPIYGQDDAYIAAGARIAPSASKALGADIVLKIRPPTVDEAKSMKDGVRLVSHIQVGVRSGAE